MARAAVSRETATALGLSRNTVRRFARAADPEEILAIAASIRAFAAIMKERRDRKLLERRSKPPSPPGNPP